MSIPAAYLGIVLGYHRMLCHRAFTPHPAVKAILLYLGALPFLATPSEFVAQHLADAVWREASGRSLVLAHGQPRNRQPRDRQLLLAVGQQRRAQVRVIDQVEQASAGGIGPPLAQPQSAQA